MSTSPQPLPVGAAFAPLPQPLGAAFHVALGAGRTLAPAPLRRTGSDGAGWRRFYWDKMVEEWGNEGIERANSGAAAGLGVAELADRKQEPERGGPPASHHIARPATAGAGHRASGELVEPERGPIAKAFRFFDRALEPAAQAAGKVEAGLSKYHGVSTPARQGLRGYEGRCGFAAIEQSRAGAALYGVVKRALGVKRLDQALPSLLKIQHAIEG